MVCVAAAMPTVATVTVVTFSGWGLKICKQAAITECLWPLGKGKVCHTHEECMWGAHLPSVGREPIGGQTTEVSQCETRLTVTFPAAGYHRPLTGTKLYYLVTEAHVCKQLAQGCYLKAERPRVETKAL